MSNTDPVGENCWDMLKLTICPLLTWKSGTFLLFMIVISYMNIKILIFYGVSMSIGPIGSVFLSPSIESLRRMGAIAPKYIKRK